MIITAKNIKRIIVGNAKKIVAEVTEKVKAAAAETSAENKEAVKKEARDASKSLGAFCIKNGYLLLDGLKTR